MKKYILILLLLVFVCSLLVSSTIISLPDEEWLQNDAANSDIINIKTKTDIATAILDEAYNENKANTMFSPLSLDMAVGMVSNGASNNSAFKDFLKNDNYADFAKAYLQHADLMNRSVDSKYLKYKTIFEITNSVWIDNTVSLNPKFEHDLNCYELEAQFVDFDNKTDVVNCINDWCYQKTHHMIREIIQAQNINTRTKLIAINAVYFESPWCEDWNVVKQPTDFIKFDGNKINPKFIQTSTSLYFENKHATAFGVNYQNGLTFIGILPKKSGDFSLSSLNLDELLASKTTKYDVKATMPTFKFDNRITNLKETMSNMGYEDIFAEGILDCMVLQDGNTKTMTISDIVQMDAIELDENGTKAAAVTAITMDVTGAITTPKIKKEVTINRPFAFLIYDSKMEQIVFVGKVVNPF